MTFPMRKAYTLAIVILLVCLSLVPAAPLRPAAAALSQPLPSTQAGLPLDLMNAVLSASARPFEAVNDAFQARAGGLELALNAGGLRASRAGLTWGLSLTAFGRDSAQAAALPAAEVVQTDARLEYRRGGLTEWYRATGLGLEQGFTLQQPPSGAGALRLQLAVAGGWTGTADADGRGLSFPLAGGLTLRYDHLRAWDAAGTELAASLSAEPGQVTLRVDDRGAAYPITIDPLVYIEQKMLAVGEGGDHFGSAAAVAGDIALVGVSVDMVGTNSHQGSVYAFSRTAGVWSLQQILVASDGGANDFFGNALAFSGTTALIGAKYDAIDGKPAQGAAYVFTLSGNTWSEQKKLIAADGQTWDEFGISVALSGDTALIGAHGADVGGSVDQGAAYVFTRVGTTWTQRAKLVAADGASSDQFGYSVALAGSTALVGAKSDDTAPGSLATGSAYVFTGGGAAWQQQAQLLAPDRADMDDFGYAVSLSDDGNTALVGAYNAAVSGRTGQGSAYVFTRSATWSLQQKLTAADGAAGDRFGHALTLSSDGNTALIGAYCDDFDTIISQGSAYVFTRSAATWSQQAKLTAADGSSSASFGNAVALSGGTALIGAWAEKIGNRIEQGSAYVFTLSGTTWGQQQKLVGTDGEANDQFGGPVAISGSTAIVGVRFDDIDGNDSQGSAYVFVRSAGTWALQQKLTAPDAATFDSFGSAVALSGDTALVGAFWRSESGYANQGAAYVFVRSAGTWTHQQKLMASDRAATDQFGYAVAVSGDTALVGALTHDNGAHLDQGAAYVFTRTGSTWAEQQKLFAADGAANDRFGNAVALSGNTALVGAYKADVSTAADRGAAYVFVRSETNWSQQQKLTAADGLAYDEFGNAVALAGDTALVGAWNDKVGANILQGSAYVFTRSATTWSLQQKLTAADGAQQDNFGTSVALAEDGGTALVGALAAHGGGNDVVGAAYLFTRERTTWTQQHKFSASDAMNGDRFGNAVAISEDANFLLVGSPRKDVASNPDQGAIYFYDALPVVSGITRADANPTRATSVEFSVTFNEKVDNVDSADFSLTATGTLSGASITSVTSLSQPSSTYTVRVATGSGTGTLRLDVDSKASIADAGGNALLALPYTAGQIYTVDRTAPAVSSIVRADPDNPAAGSSARFTVTFTESVTGIQAADFRLTSTVSGASITGVSGSGAVYTVTVNTGSGRGKLRLDLPFTATAADAVGNTLTALPYTAGQSYTRGREVFIPILRR